MGFIRNILLSILHENTHTNIMTSQPKEIVSAIDTFILMHNTQVAESESEMATRDDVIESAIHHFLKRHMWIYGKAPRQEKVKNQDSPNVVDFRDTKRPEVHFTIGKRQAR